MSAVGTFVSGDKKGGSNTFGGNFLTGVGRESREVTLKNARAKIVSLTQQLRLRKDHVDMSFHFYKLALNKGITRGRKSAHVIAACVYITCRTESTGHMLIDISDVLEVDVYQLGRAYLRLSQELCINIPVMDPCVYVMRYAPMLEFGEKTHEVSNTALRLLSRMKKDWIHFGRRPSGLCGAALLISSRLHEFNRSLENILKVVKVHESTLRKRLNEFSQTSASELTLDEFFTVDLDAPPEMDPPCYTSGRMKDQELLDREGKMSSFEREMNKLEEKIEKELEERRASVMKRRLKMSSSSALEWSSSSSDSELEEVKRKSQTDIDDDEIESFLLSPEEVKFKTQLWMKVNKEYLTEQQEKLEKKKKVYKKRKSGISDTAVEAIEKMAVDKKISTKINYDVLKNLTVVPKKSTDDLVKSPSKEEISPSEISSIPSCLKNFPTIAMRGSKKMKVDKKPTLVTRAVPKKLVISDPELNKPVACADNLLGATAANSDDADEDDLSDNL